MRFLSNKEIEELKKIELISEYLTDKQAEINEFNKSNDVNKEVLINGRNLTNVGVFRKYMDEYLTNHPAMNKDMMIMVRQLSPTTQGIPLEIYAFSSDKRWANYEYIMADVFDHFLAAVPYFKIELFELQHSTEIN